MEICVIGAGLGGLAAAISCAKNGMHVALWEQAPEFLPIGAGIQIPPNGGRALRYLGLDDQIIKTGAVALDAINLRNFEDGELLLSRHGKPDFERDYGADWYVVHRADYHRLLLDEAVRLGVEVHLGSRITDIDFTPGAAAITLGSGKVIQYDVVIGADGLWSMTRGMILDSDATPINTGDMAYRATLTREQLKALGHKRLDDLLSNKEVNAWIGPNSHAVFYPLKNASVYNLVLLCPDVLPPDVDKIEADVKEMREAFEGWDPILRDVINLVPKVLKWRLCHQEELERWTKGNVVIIGDACHPTLPYQAQGAAMAVEDGAILGLLLGKLSEHVSSERKRDSVPGVLELFERLRKHRTTVNVKGAVDNRRLFHMEDGEKRAARNDMLADTDWQHQTETEFMWNDLQYQADMLGFDFIADAEKSFDNWMSKEKPEVQASL